MPQLDQVTYLSQSFWLWFFFIGFFFATLIFILPKLSRVFKLRREALTSIYYLRTGFFRESSTACLDLSSACVLDSLDIKKEVSDAAALRATEKVEIQSVRRRVALKCASFFVPFHWIWNKKYHQESLTAVQLDLAYSLVIHPLLDVVESEKPLMLVVLRGDN